MPNLVGTLPLPRIVSRLKKKPNLQPLGSQPFLIYCFNEPLLGGESDLPQSWLACVKDLNDGKLLNS